MSMFTVGPVPMRESTLLVQSKQVPYSRLPGFSSMVHDIEYMLRDVLFARDDDRVLLLTASGSGAMEAVVINTLSKDDKVLVIQGGSFGERFVQLCALHGIPHTALELPWGETLTAKHLEPFARQGYTALLSNIHETEHGQLYDIDLLSSFCRSNDLLLVVDAISSFLADPVNIEEHDIDVLIVSSQKGLALAPGLSMVVLSQKVIDERVNRIDSGSMYFDFKAALLNADRGQTPFTPAVGVVYQLHDRLQQIQRDGVASEIATVQELALDFRNRLRELPLTIPTYPLSNALTPVIFTDDIAYRVFETLQQDYDILVTPNGGRLRDKLFRVGHIGVHTLEENELLTSALAKTVEKIRGDHGL